MIEFLVLGVLLGSVPLITLLLQRLFKLKVEECEQIRDEITKTLGALNELHNNAALAYKNLNQQVDKLQSEMTVLKANVQKKGNIW